MSTEEKSFFSSHLSILISCEIKLVLKGLLRFEKREEGAFVCEFHEKKETRLNPEDCKKKGKYLTEM
jgi:hypothetical protein